MRVEGKRGLTPLLSLFPDSGDALLVPFPQYFLIATMSAFVLVFTVAVAVLLNTTIPAATAVAAVTSRACTTAAITAAGAQVHESRWR